METLSSNPASGFNANQHPPSTSTMTTTTNNNNATPLTNNHYQPHPYSNGLGSSSIPRPGPQNVRHPSPNTAGSSPTAVGLVSCSALPPQIPCLTTTPKKSMYVRALFDYNPNTDSGLPSRGLPFQHGDILHVVNASDREWWQARRLMAADDNDNTLNNSLCKSMANTQLTAPSVNHTTSTTLYSSSLGIIPSRQRLERRQRIRSKHVNFLGKVTVIGSAAPNNFTNPAEFAEYTNGDTEFVDPMSMGQNHQMMTPYSTLPPPALPRSVMIGSHSAAPSEASSVTTMADGRVDTDKKKRSNSLSRIFFKRFCYRSNKPNSSGPVSITRTGSLDAVNDNRMETVRSYDLVVPITIGFARPVLLFGPLKERVMDELLQDRKYATCVPHTNRPPNAGELDGVDYHFVASKAAMEAEIKAGRFVDVGQFQDYYYATSVDSIRRTCQSGRICLLDLNMDAAKRLEDAELFPITILLKPESVARLRSLQRRLTEDQAKRSLEMADRLDHENWRFLSTIITYDSIENAVHAVQQFVQIHNGPVIWVPPHAARTYLPGKDFNLAGSASSTLPRSPQHMLNQVTSHSPTMPGSTNNNSNRGSPRPTNDKYA